jgi:3-oxoacyl-[acyl-carrier protein] reductase
VKGLSGKTVLVTGGGGAIGSAICRRFIEAGCEILVADKNEKAAEGTAGQLKGKALVFDIADYAKAKAILAKEKIDILVNNAGWDRFQNFLDTRPEEWEQLIDINLRGPLNMHHIVAPGMAARGWGRIVNIASVAGKEGNPNASAYSASKAGVIGLTKSLGKELATTGVLVNCVAPAVVKTELFSQMTEQHIQFMLSKIPMNRFGEVDEVAEMVMWLASPLCTFSTGAVFDLTGGRATY